MTPYSPSRGINWAHPLAKRLRCLVTVEHGVPYEWVLRKPFVRVNEASTVGYPETRRLGAVTDGSNDYWELTNSWSFTSEAGVGMAMAGRLNPAVSQSDKRAVAFGHSTNATPILALDVENNASYKMQAFARPTSGNDLTHLGPNTGSNTGDRTFVWVHDRANLHDPSFNRTITWQDRTINSGANIDSTAVFTVNRLLIGALGRSTVVSHYNGSVAWYAMWERTLRPVEVEQMWGDPVSLLLRRAPVLTVVPAAGGGGSILPHMMQFAAG